MWVSLSKFRRADSLSLDRRSGFPTSRSRDSLTATASANIPDILLELPTAPGFQKYISTGYPDLDTALGGGVPCGHVSVIAGPSGYGKTLFARSLMNMGTATWLYNNSFKEFPGKLTTNWPCDGSLFSK